MQTLAAGRTHFVPVGLHVVPRLVGIAGFHGRDDMHQARAIPAPFQHLGDNAFLADMALCDVFDRDIGCVRHARRRRTHLIAQFRGKVGILENANAVRVEKPRHPVGVAHRGQCPGDDHPVVATQNPRDPGVVTLLKCPGHHTLDCCGL